MEPPPQYAPPSPTGTLCGSGSYRASANAAEIIETDADLAFKAVNFVYRHLYFDEISATYIIDPNAQDPLHLSTSSKRKSGQKNLFLQSECGSINVDVRVLDTETKATGQEGRGGNANRVSLDFRATFGSIDVKLVGTL